MDYFQLFDLAVAPTVDKSKVSKKYFELQKKYHPDFYTRKTEVEQEDVLQLSAAVNKAYKIFTNQERTIEYFLQATGLVKTDEKYELSPDFLMEMMELNETLLEKDENAARSEVEEYEQKLYDDIRGVIENYTVGVTIGDDLQKLKAYYYKKKYLQRILDRLGD